MLLKKYLYDYVIDGLDWRLIIIIIHDKSTFSANDNCQKVWTLNSQGVLQPKRKGKEIIVSDFLTS